MSLFGVRRCCCQILNRPLCAWYDVRMTVSITVRGVEDGGRQEVDPPEPPFVTFQQCAVAPGPRSFSMAWADVPFTLGVAGSGSTPDLELGDDEWLTSPPFSRATYPNQSFRFRLFQRASVVYENGLRYFGSASGNSNAFLSACEADQPESQISGNFDFAVDLPCSATLGDLADALTGEFNKDQSIVLCCGFGSGPTFYVQNTDSLLAVTFADP